MDDARTHNRTLAALIIETGESDQDVAEKVKASVYFIQELRRRINDIGLIQAVRGHDHKHSIAALKSKSRTVLIATQPPPHGEKRWTPAILSKELSTRGAENVNPESVIR